MSRRKSDGERMTEPLHRFYEFRPALAACIDRIIRRRMAEAWDQGNISPGHLKDNPYRKKRAKP